MKNKNQNFAKLNNRNRKISRLSAGIPIITCWIILFSFVMQVQGQRSNTEIDRQRTKVEEAFIHDIVVLSTAVIEATEDIPKHILVRGYTMPSNYFLMRFPVNTWNKKIYMDGCGLGCGTLPADISGKLRKALQRGYATTATNSGHWAPSIRDFTWAYNNPQAEVEFAYRAVHETIRAMKELVKTFYGREAEYSYFWGCSTGGRQAVTAATKYPEDFDGVISEGPVLNWIDVVKLHVWLYQTNTGPDGKEIIVQEDLSVISQAVYNACDKADGQVDGLVSDPTNCQFDPEFLICDDGTACLSREKVEVLKKWYQGPVNANGEKLLTNGIPIASEPFWAFWLLGQSDEPLDAFIPSQEMLRYLFFKEDPGESYSLFDFDFNVDADGKNTMGHLLNVNHFSLKKFKDEGGKMLLFHGLADPVIPYQFSVDYYNRNFEEFGEETENFFRLFLIPGMDHCTAFSTLGVTDDSVDPLTALEAWVEQDDAPQELSVTRYKNDGVMDSQFTVPQYIVNDR